MTEWNHSETLWGSSIATVVMGHVLLLSIQNHNQRVRHLKWWPDCPMAICRTNGVGSVVIRRTGQHVPSLNKSWRPFTFNIVVPSPRSSSHINLLSYIPLPSGGKKCWLVLWLDVRRTRDVTYYAYGHYIYIWSLCCSQLYSLTSTDWSLRVTHPTRLTRGRLHHSTTCILQLPGTSYIYRFFIYPTHPAHSTYNTTFQTPQC